MISHLRRNHLQVGLEKMREWGMRRVHEDFRVVALGLPVPPFKVRQIQSNIIVFII